VGDGGRADLDDDAYPASVDKYNQPPNHIPISEALTALFQLGPKSLPGPGQLPAPHRVRTVFDMIQRLTTVDDPYLYAAAAALQQMKDTIRCALEPLDTAAARAAAPTYIAFLSDCAVNVRSFCLTLKAPVYERGVLDEIGTADLFALLARLLETIAMIEHALEGAAKSLEGAAEVMEGAVKALVAAATHVRDVKDKRAGLAQFHFALGKDSGEWPWPPGTAYCFTLPTACSLSLHMGARARTPKQIKGDVVAFGLISEKVMAGMHQRSCIHTAIKSQLAKSGSPSFSDIVRRPDLEGEGPNDPAWWAPALIDKGDLGEPDRPAGTAAEEIAWAWTSLLKRSVPRTKVHFYSHAQLLAELQSDRCTERFSKERKTYWLEAPTGKIPAMIKLDLDRLSMVPPFMFRESDVDASVKRSVLAGLAANWEALSANWRTKQADEKAAKKAKVAADKAGAAGAAGAAGTAGPSSSPPPQKTRAHSPADGAGATGAIKTTTAMDGDM
jgi:hypothetical protein